MTPTQRDDAERAFTQAGQIRQRARELMFEKEARVKLQPAARAPRAA